MPDTETLLSPSHERVQPTFGAAHSQYSPLTSDSHIQDLDEAQQHSLSPAQSLSAGANLRKSISVDSFIGHRRSSPMTVGRQGRTNTVGTGADEPRFVPPATMAWQPHNTDDPHILYRERDSRSSRSRGASISTSSDYRSATDSSSSSSDRIHDLPTFDHGPGRSIFKGKARVQHIIPPEPGDLPLPSRLSGLSSPSSMSSLSAASTQTRDDAQRLPPISPAGPSHWPAGLAESFAVSGRARSGSVGQAGGDHTRLNTAFGLSKDDLRPVTVAVVGEPCCGKSTAIVKGLKGYDLTEEVQKADLLSSRGIFDYTFHEGRIVQQAGIEVKVRVLEVNISYLNLNDRGSIWPEGATPLDGVFVCYDVSEESSFARVEGVLQGFRDLKLPTVVFACKCDLDRHIQSNGVYERLNRYDVGLIEVTAVEDGGKTNLRLGFEWLLKAIFTERKIVRGDQSAYSNPASPEQLRSPQPWDISRSAAATPTAATSHNSSSYTQAPVSSSAGQRSSAPPTSPTRARSTSDLHSGHEASRHQELDRQKTRSIISLSIHSSDGNASLQTPNSVPNDGLTSVDEAAEDRVDTKEKDSRPAPWATLEELLDKLLFLAVSGDDWGYINQFLLTYRRFASPRSVVLAMQKRMRQLDQASNDPMFACFAQMRLCHLLEVWIHDYPHDFAVGATADALNALVKSIVSKTHLLHYGSDFLPFLESRPTTDHDAKWALKVEEPTTESDDAYSEEEEAAVAVAQGGQSPASAVEDASQTRSTPSVPVSSRERKSSLPLTAKALVMPNSFPSQPPPNPIYEDSEATIIRTLKTVSSELLLMDSAEVAQEITRICTKLLLQIEPRHWLQHTLVSGRKEPDEDPIARFGEVSNHLANWVVSLILCHDKPKSRARTIEKVVEIAQKLRGLNNYSALRAFVAGIHAAAPYTGDKSMELFQQKNPNLWKSLQSWELLLQAVRSHRAYRMALRNTKGPCIPAMEVHVGDLIRAHEGNDDFKASDSTKIHWAKFSMIGKFILSTVQFQNQCRTSTEYMFEERPRICDMLMRDCVMDIELQRSRIAIPPEEDDDEVPYRAFLPRPVSQDPAHFSVLTKIKKWF
ncbi:hypothetical protein EWM64_g3895 [Hericium alpestre]|uniref:Ras-GEF domain-containing protein n=1 Tax=Hericium alpestre TaxID=135208 RepID=A0A4Z0A0Z7_9AGAM|nr:hypothetical protein EWM64_g3895 [Hericium alpestre]